MSPAGHLAAAYFVSSIRRTERLARFVPAALGALLPDLIDKSAQWYGLTPYGRTVGHSLLVWSIAVLAWAPWHRSETARPVKWLLLGGISHLAVDLGNDVLEGLFYTGYVFSAWFGWPLTNPDMWNIASPHLFGRIPNGLTPLEIFTLAACLSHALLAFGRR